MLTDEKIQEIKGQTMAQDYSPRLNNFARAIERAAIAKYELMDAGYKEQYEYLRDGIECLLSAIEHDPDDDCAESHIYVTFLQDFAEFAKSKGIKFVAGEDQCGFAITEQSENERGVIDQTGRSPQGYAIEHAEYMALSAEQLLNHLNECTNVEDGVIEPDDAYSDYTSGLRASIYDFRKRRDRALLPAAQQEMKLEKDARVGHGIFRKGVRVSTLLGAAYRAYENEPAQDIPEGAICFPNKVSDHELEQSHELPAHEFNDAPCYNE